MFTELKFDNWNVTHQLFACIALHVQQNVGWLAWHMELCLQETLLLEWLKPSGYPTAK